MLLFLILGAAFMVTVIVLVICAAATLLEQLPISYDPSEVLDRAPSKSSVTLPHLTLVSGNPDGLLRGRRSSNGPRSRPTGGS